jgi:ribosomal protein S18 acetylase RimI-like enzyme
MIEVNIASGQLDQIPFLAWVSRTAARSHLPKGGFDLFVDGTDDECLRFIEALFTTDTRSWARYEKFLVAEADGLPVGALTGFFVDEVDGSVLGAAAREAALKLAWTEEEVTEGWRRCGSAALLTMNRSPGAWIVEAVAVRPEYRRMGIVDRLISGILERGKERGASEAEISVAIGNEPAQRAYEKAGFAVVQEAIHPLFEVAYGCPGMRLMRRDL